MTTSVQGSDETWTMNLPIFNSFPSPQDFFKPKRIKTESQKTALSTFQRHKYIKRSRRYVPRKLSRTDERSKSRAYLYAEFL